MNRVYAIFNRSIYVQRNGKVSILRNLILQRYANSKQVENVLPVKTLPSLPELITYTKINLCTAKLRYLNIYVNGWVVGIVVTGCYLFRKITRFIFTLTVFILRNMKNNK